MQVNEICPICDSTNIFLVHGGYLCNACEARLIKHDGRLSEVTDFVSCEPTVRQLGKNLGELYRIMGKDKKYAEYYFDSGKPN